MHNRHSLYASKDTVTSRFEPLAATSDLPGTFEMG
jgi:hypothetical protein